MKSCLRLLREVNDALRSYWIDCALYPPSGNKELVRSLLAPPSRSHGYLTFPENLISRAGELLDPWGRPLIYQNRRAFREGMVEEPIGSYVLYSRGPDGRSRIQLDDSCKPRRRPRS